MEDLHSVAAYSACWDLHNLSFFNNSDMSSPQFMDSTPPFLSSHIDGSDYSSGYLQDALLEFTSKRRRLKFSLQDQDQDHPNLYNSEYSMNYPQNCDYFSQIMTKSDSISGEFISRSNEEVSIFPETISNLETIEASSSLNKGSLNTKSCSDKEILHLPSIAPGKVEEKRKKSWMINKVVYPFAVVKPGGVEGDVTLNDINERILMPPTKAVRHPVGEFACRPIVSSSDGAGLSGKKVVALTRIHTHGKGTITIIRTRD